MKDEGITKTERYRFDFRGHPCVGCGKELAEGNTFYVEFPGIPNVVDEQRMYCSGCAVAAGSKRGGRSVAVAAPDIIIQDDIVEEAAFPDEGAVGADDAVVAETEPARVPAKPRAPVKRRVRRRG